MRRIDLSCKLFGPLSIALVDGFSMTIAIWLLFGLSVFSVLVEVYAITQVRPLNSFSPFSNLFTQGVLSGALTPKPSITPSLFRGWD